MEVAGSSPVYRSSYCFPLAGTGDFFIACRMKYRVVDNCKTVYSVREIPLLPEVKRFYDLIREWQEVHKIDTPYLCDDGDGVILVQSLATTLRKLCLLCDVPYFHSHMIRKTFATKLHFSGVPTRVISDLMGHAEIGTTHPVLHHADLTAIFQPLIVLGLRGMDTDNSPFKIKIITGQG